MCGWIIAMNSCHDTLAEEEDVIVMKKITKKKNDEEEGKYRINYKENKHELN